MFTGTGCSRNVAATRRHTASSPCWGRGLWGGAEPGLRSTAGLRGQPAAGGHDETDDGDGAGEEGADAHDGAAETAAHSRAEAAAAAAAAGRTGECDGVEECAHIPKQRFYSCRTQGCKDT